MRSVKALVIGLVIAGFGIATLYANRPERIQSITNELVEATAVLPENEGKLVMVSGTPRLVDGGVIVDEEAGLRVENALYYSRIPYQKVYVLRTRKVVVDQGDDKLSTVDDVTETEHYVAEDWINADHERDAVISRTSVRYENPPALHMGSYHALGDLRMGDFKISYADVSDYIQSENGSFTQAELNDACGTYIRRSEIDLRAVTNAYGHGMLSNGDDIGDVHVTFSYATLVGAEPVTIIGRQREGRLVVEADDLVSESESVQAGLVSKEALVAALSTEDASSRRIGIIGVVLGAVIMLLSFEWDFSRFRR